MGSHAKPRTTGRKTALGALAVGATLTGVGLTAAALDPATAVLTADSAPGTAATIQLSGLADPVAVSPGAPVQQLAAAPLTGLGSPTAVSRGPVRAATTHTVRVPTAAVAPGSGRTAIKPIPQGSSSLTEGYAGKHRGQTRSAAPPADVTPIAQPGSVPVGSAPPASGGLSQLPLVSGLLGGTGLPAVPTGAAAGPLGSLLGGTPVGALLSAL